MKVHVHFYSQLREIAGAQARDVELSRGAKVSELLDKIYEKVPMLRSHDKTILIGAGVEFVDRNYKLREGEEIAIMPPVQGG